MRNLKKLLGAAAGAVFVVLGAGEYARATTITTDSSSVPFQGVTDIHRTVTGDRYLDMHIVKINLSDPGISFRVTESNGTDPSDTKAETTLAYVKRVNAQIGINANFYGIDITTGNTDILSLAASNGNAYSPWEGYLNGVNISSNNVATIISGTANTYNTDPSISLYNAVSGNPLLVSNGNNVGKKSDDPNSANYKAPRTAIGLGANNELLLFVADGRQPGYSEGMTFGEVADVLIEFGAVDAINLDGGGSTTLAFCQPSCALVNKPSNFSGYPRPVGNNLAVFAAPTEPTSVPFEFSPGLGILALGAWGVMAGLKSKEIR